MHDWIAQIHGNRAPFPIPEIAVKLSLAVAIGMLVGIEREWSNKEVGARTFSLTAMLGLIAALVSPQAVLLAGGAVLVLIAGLTLRSTQPARKLEATTSIALMLVFVIGILVAYGHLFTPVSCAVVMTMLLSLKPQLRRFAGRLQPQEVRSALLLGLFGFVIWPLLPNRTIDPWSLVDPREAWVTVVVLACLGFINYVLLRIYGARGIYPTALLGGLVNSTATAAELSSALPGMGLKKKVVPAILISSAAMFSRNLVILALFAGSAVSKAWLPLLAMASVALIWVVIYERRAPGETPKPSEGQEDEDATGLVELGSPISMTRVLKLAGLFLSIQIAGTLAQRRLGNLGLQAVSLIGGLVSSASSTAAAATMVQHGRAQPEQVAVATVLASLSSAAMNLPIVRRQPGAASAFVELCIATASQALLGIGALLLALHLFGAR